MTHPLDITNKKLNRFLSDLSQCDQTITSTEVRSEYSPLFEDWTVSESIAISAIVDCKTVSQLLETLCVQGSDANVQRVRYYSIESDGSLPCLVRKDCFGHSEKRTAKIRDNGIHETITPESVRKSQPFWSLLIRRPLILVRSNGQRTINTSPGIVLTEDCCLEVLGEEKSETWVDIPLIVGGQIYGKLSFDISGLPEDGTASPEIIRLWSLCHFAAPFIEVLGSNGKPVRLDDRLFTLDDKVHSSKDGVELFSKLLVLEKALASIENTWVYAKALRRDEVVFTYVNEAFAKANGTSAELMIGKTDGDFNDNDEEVRGYKKVDLSILKHNEKKVDIKHETWTGKSPSATKRHFTTTKELVDLDGVRQLIGIATDITPRFTLESEATARMQRESSTFRGVLNAIDCHVVIKNLVGKYLYCNQKFASFVGCEDPSEVCDKGVDSIWDEASVTADQEEDRLVITTAQATVPTKRTVTFRSGESTLLLIQTIPIISTTIPQKVVGVCSVSTYMESNRLGSASTSVCCRSNALVMATKIVQATMEPLCDLLEIASK